MRIIVILFLALNVINISVENSNIFHTEEQTITSINGSEAMLKCTIKVNLNYTQFLNVSWIKSPRQILTRGFFRVTENNRFHLQQPAILNTQIFNLKISPVILMDEGQYRCNFIYGRKIFAKVVRLIVQVPPQMKKHPSPLVKVDEGKSFKLTCSAIGKPPPSYKWFLVVNHDDETKLILLHYAIGKYDTDVSISGGNLTIAKANRHMKGTYRCQAENNIGRVHWDTRLLVLYPPEIVMANEVITQGINQNTAIDCTLNAYPLGVITWYFEPGHVALKTNLCGIINDNAMKYCMIEQRPNSDNGEVKLISKLTLFRLTNSDFGSYVCTSKTIFGSASGSTHLKMTSVQSKEEDVITPEERVYKSLREDSIIRYGTTTPWTKFEVENPSKLLRYKSMEQNQQKKDAPGINQWTVAIDICICFIVYIL